MCANFFFSSIFNNKIRSQAGVGAQSSNIRPSAIGQALLSITLLDFTSSCFCLHCSFSIEEVEVL